MLCQVSMKRGLKGLIASVVAISGYSLDEKRIESCTRSLSPLRLTFLSRWKEDWKYPSSQLSHLLWECVSMKRGLKEELMRALDIMPYWRLDEKRIESEAGRCYPLPPLNQSRWKEDWKGSDLTPTSGQSYKSRWKEDWKLSHTPPSIAASQLSRWKEDWK